MKPDEQQKLIKDYRKKFEDFDNHIIVNSAAEVLRHHNIDNFAFLQVGPDYPGNDFVLADQLRNRINKNIRYIFFSLPTLKGKHSVGVILDTEEKSCHLIDSLACRYQEAESQLQNAIDSDILPGYAIIKPPASIKQQNDNWSCGIHTAANIVGILAGDIDIKTRKGLQPRTAKEVNQLLGLFCKAYEESHKRYEKNMEEPRLRVRHKKILKSALEESLRLLQAMNVIIDDKDVQSLVDALSVECPIGMNDEEKSKQRSLKDFLTEFVAKNPDNSLLVLLEADHFFQSFPIHTKHENERTGDNIIKKIMGVIYQDFDLEKARYIEEINNYISRRKLQAKNEFAITTFFRRITGDGYELKINAANKMLNALSGKKVCFEEDEYGALTDSKLGKIHQKFSAINKRLHYNGSITLRHSREHLQKEYFITTKI